MDRGRRERYSSRSASRGRGNRNSYFSSRRNQRNDSRERSRNTGARRQSFAPPAFSSSKRYQRSDSREKSNDRRWTSNNNSSRGDRGGQSSDRVWTNPNSSSQQKTANSSRRGRSDSRERRGGRGAARSGSPAAQAAESSQRTSLNSAPPARAPPLPPVPPPPPMQPPPPPSGPGYMNNFDASAFVKSSPQRPPPGLLRCSPYGHSSSTPNVPQGVAAYGASAHQQPMQQPYGGLPPQHAASSLPQQSANAATPAHSKAQRARSVESVLSRAESLISRTEEEKTLDPDQVPEEEKSKSRSPLRKPMPEFIVEKGRMTRLPRVRIVEKVKKKKNRKKRDKEGDDEKDTSSKKSDDEEDDEDKDKTKDDNDSWPASEGESSSDSTSSSSKRDRTPSPVHGFSIKDWLHPVGGKFMKPSDDPFGLRGKTTKYKYKELNRPPTRKDPPQVQYSAGSMLSEAYADLLAQKFCSCGVKAKVIEPTKKMSRASRHVEKSLKSDKHRKHHKLTERRSSDKREKKKLRGHNDFV